MIEESMREKIERRFELKKIAEEKATEKALDEIRRGVYLCGDEGDEDDDSADPEIDLHSEDHLDDYDDTNLN